MHWDFPRAGNIFSRGERYCPLLTADNQRAGRLCNVSAVIKSVRTVYLASAYVRARAHTDVGLNDVQHYYVRERG